MADAPTAGARLAPAGSPHENGRTYVLEAPPEDLAAPLRTWLCPRNRVLAKLLERHKLVPTLGKGAEGLPWLRTALAECNRGRPAGGAGAAQRGGQT